MNDKNVRFFGYYKKWEIDDLDQDSQDRVPENKEAQFCEIENSQTSCKSGNYKKPPLGIGMISALIRFHILVNKSKVEIIGVHLDHEYTRHLVDYRYVERL